MPEGLYWILASALQFDPAKRVFTEPDVSHPPDASIARWMEKSLDKFAADYAQQQHQALAAALSRLGVLDRSVTSSDAKLTPAILLADRVKQIRSRISHLRENTVEVNLPDAVTALSSEVDDIAQEVAQLFEDRDVRQALAGAQQDLAREDARAQRELERSEARLADETAAGDAESTQPNGIVSASQQTTPGTGGNTSADGPDLTSRRNVLLVAALAACLVAGLAFGHLSSGRGESLITGALPTATASPTVSTPAIALAPPSVVTNVIPVPSASASASSSVNTEPESVRDAGVADAPTTFVDAGAAPTLPVLTAKPVVKPTQKKEVDPYDAL